MPEQYKKAVGAESGSNIPFLQTTSISSIRKSLNLYKKHDLQPGTQISLSQIFQLHNTGVLPEKGVKGEPYFKIGQVIAIQIAAYESNYEKGFPDRILSEYGFSRPNLEHFISGTTQIDVEPEKPTTKLKRDMDIYFDYIREISKAYPHLDHREEISLSNIIREGSVPKAIQIREEIEFSKNNGIVNIYCQSKELADWVYSIGQEIKTKNKGIVKSCKKETVSESARDRNNNFRYEVVHHLKKGASLEFEIAAPGRYSKFLSKPIAGLDGPLKESRIVRLKYRTQKAAKAKERLINSNLALVIYIIGEYYGSPSMDKISMGNVGLVKAVDSYNGKYRFSTHASASIRGYIQNNTKPIPLFTTSNFSRLYRSINRVREELLQTLSRDPAPDEVYEYLQAERKQGKLHGLRKDLSKSVVGDVLKISDLDILSLNYGWGTFDQLYAEIPDNTFTDAETIFMIKEATELPDDLSPIERDIIEMNFGLNGNQPMTLEAIGDTMGIGRESIRKLRNRGLDRFLISGGLTK